MAKRTEAIVVLGCRLLVDSRGTLSEHGVLAHRLVAAAQAYAQRGPERTIVVASGGRRWGRFVEADVMAHELARRGVPESAMVRERCSFTTRDNARFTAALLARREIDRAVVVTSDWHLRRAVAFFRQTGLRVEGIPAYQPAPWTTRVRRRAIERLLMWLQAAFVVFLCVGCSKGAPTAPVQQDAAPPAPQTVLRSIDRAEDLRRAKDISEEVRWSRDRAIRQRAVRALARILDSDDTPLLRALEDDDEETVTWAGYGLGESCRGREESHVRALAARLESLDDSAGHGAPHARAAIVRALGRCGGDRAEQTLRGCLERRDVAAPSQAGAVEFDEAVAYAFGDFAAQRGSLPTASAAALVDAALANPPLDAALYPFGRIDGPPGEELEPRLFAAARSAFERPGPARIFAVRAMGHTNPRAAARELARVLTSDAFTPAERAEAARTLGRLRDAGQQALAVALKSIAPEAASLTSDRFGVVLTALMALGDGAQDGAQETLSTIARIALPPGSPAALARRMSAMRCAAAERLARDAWESAVIRDCDVADGESGERARLAALERGQLVKARRAVWLELLRKTTHVRVRERAIDAVAHHPELGDVARDVLAEALGGSSPGVVATAANVIRAHPDRFYVLAERERRDALDPSVSPPKGSPARELDSRISAALRSAIARPWTEDLVETRAALVDAALSVGLDEARAFALAACHDANVTMRTRASTALAAAGVMTNCPPRDGGLVPAPETDRSISHPTRVVFDTDAGVLGIVFDPALAPMAATRLVALARSGFYTGMAVHRVVPGFVVQLGDPGGDGYGGSGSLLRCETSPVPFRLLDVGVALAGRDTGSSQFFVVLARYPHLDGQYTWVGRADGDWNAVTEGDLVHRVRLEE